jgi:lipopolysaccharide/colanic/teichoic acid biosynthesis glycosyltransferase
LLSSSRARALKRLVDLVAATGLIVAGVPLCLLVAIAIKVEDGGPILFRQLRVGRRQKCFVLYKLRSMRPDAEAASGPRWATVDDERVTRVGWWLRALRIDEIPQAWNVLRGQMSFIGPRPERPEFVALLRREIAGYDRRLLVRPGITGWAQVNQPYAGTVEDARLKLEYDVEYIERYSIWLDFRITLRTARIILLGWGHPSGKAA